MMRKAEASATILASLSLVVAVSVSMVVPIVADPATSDSSARGIPSGSAVAMATIGVSSQSESSSGLLEETLAVLDAATTLEVAIFVFSSNCLTFASFSSPSSSQMRFWRSTSLALFSSSCVCRLRIVSWSTSMCMIFFFSSLSVAEQSTASLARSVSLV
uniref:Secreted protein n=1 Tax=Anopheles darlingi TaxID=43151 RepID=A0A2M4D002_ANODA